MAKTESFWLKRTQRPLFLRTSKNLLQKPICARIALEFYVKQPNLEKTFEDKNNFYKNNLRKGKSLKISFFPL